MNNKAFESDDVNSIENGKVINGFGHQNGKTQSDQVLSMESTDSMMPDDSEPQRENWGKSIEFLMSCIAMSVGLGNVWRFPFTALENGGGAFLLPYLIVLFIIGRPLYYLEMVIGQFSSRNSIDVYDLCPIFRGKFYEENNFGFIFIFSHNFISNWNRCWIWSNGSNILVEHVLCFYYGIDWSISL